MKRNLTTWTIFLILITVSLTSFSIENSDLSLAVVVACMILYAISSKNSSIPLNRNIVMFLSVLLFVVIFAYRLMFELTEIQSYIDDNLSKRNYVICFGSLQIQLLIMGGYIAKQKAGLNPWKKYSDTIPRPSFNYLLVMAWLPLVANLIIYLLIFRGRAYVDVYTMSHGPVGLILKTIYLSYAAIILIATGCYPAGKDFYSMQWLLLGFLLIYGLLFNLRSPFLVAILLFVYLYGQRVSTKILMLLVIASVLIFGAIGLFRDASVVEGSVGVSFITSVLSLGEFADTLRFAIERSASVLPLWGGGIVGSFLGITEPSANIYAKMVSPVYFEEGGGFGFFVLADLVLNFGKVGSSIFVFFLGWLLVKQHYIHHRVISYIFMPILFANLFAIVRNDLGSTFRGIIYTMISVALIKLVWRLLRVIPKRTFL